MLSKLQKLTDKAWRLLRDNNKISPFSVCFRTHFKMVEQHPSSPPSSPKVQSLFDLCKKTLSPSGNASPSNDSINKLCSILDTVGPADVGLKEESVDDDRGFGFFGRQLSSRVARWSQPITYIDIYECDSFTMCIFCFPTSTVIPLHDHPGMTVFSKVLYGSLHVKGYDWVEPAIYDSKEHVRLAKLAVDKVLTEESGTSILYPRSGGNLHCFTALTPCAVLDILTPSYNEDAGRKCTYYHDFPYTPSSTGDKAEPNEERIQDHAWLEEIPTPDDLYMRPGVYTGPVLRV